jgi:hypothetical protein
MKKEEKIKMAKWIQNISGIIPHTNKTISIALDGRNLIVTSANGSGKTSFLKALYEKVDLLIAKKQGADLPQLKQNLSHWQNSLGSAQKGTNNYDGIVEQIKILESQIDAIEGGMQIDMPDSINFSSLYDDRKAVIRFFVLMSTPDAVVFDLAKNEPITEDLSFYTYSAVMKGLWNIKPIPMSLENDIREIAQIANSEHKDFVRLGELVNKIKGREDTLDNGQKRFSYWD